MKSLFTPLIIFLLFLNSCNNSSTSDLCTIITEFEELTRTSKSRRQNKERVGELQQKMYEEINKIAEAGNYSSEELELELHSSCPASKELNSLFNNIDF
tara:strand:+ start:198 stop:494 length:297 start_codon:yes stop_codon:yes gene_type:complete